METKIEITPLSDPYLIKLYARGKINRSESKQNRIKTMLLDGLNTCCQKKIAWQEIQGALNQVLRKEELGIRISPAGKMPFIKFPIAVVFHRSGNYFFIFELKELPNDTQDFDLPAESNLSLTGFGDRISALNKREENFNPVGLAYGVLIELQKLQGISHWGVSLRENPMVLANYDLVIAQNPFGTEYKYPIKSSYDQKRKVQLALTSDMEKLLKEMPDGYFVQQCLTEIAQSWPWDRSANDLLNRVEWALTLMAARGMTKGTWQIDKSVNNSKCTVGWTLERELIQDGLEPGAIHFVLTSPTNHAKGIEVGVNGLTEEAVKGVQRYIDRINPPQPFFKNLISTFITKEEKQPSPEPVISVNRLSEKRAPKELFRALLHVISRDFNLPLFDIRHSAQAELKRKKLDSRFITEMIMVQLEENEPYIFIPETATSLCFKFRIERRIKDETGNYGIIQVDRDGEEIKRVSLIKSTLDLRSSHSFRPEL